ncbi:hypothetical protein SASPL_111917 [Salvia splendens]|uniref:Uncharacterized protein n=1 Tax=Salvia splendens TaxID=180675 RepID=A0A8X8Y7S2_SALSN|nr:hypothetical protein SASPL_111917 [Salvia splendens]
MGTKHHILSMYNAMKSPKVEELAMKKECKVMHVVELKEVKDKKAEASSLPEFELRSNDSMVKKIWWKKRLEVSYFSRRKEEANISINGEVK